MAIGVTFPHVILFGASTSNAVGISLFKVSSILVSEILSYMVIVPARVVVAFHILVWVFGLPLALYKSISASSSVCVITKLSARGVSPPPT